MGTKWSYGLAMHSGIHSGIHLAAHSGIRLGLHSGIHSGGVDNTVAHVGLRYLSLVSALLVRHAAQNSLQQKWSLQILTRLRMQPLLTFVVSRFFSPPMFHYHVVLYFKYFHNISLVFLGISADSKS